MSYKVDGILKKQKTRDGFYKYYVENGTRYFKEFEDAFEYSNKVYNFTKIMLGIRKKSKKKTKILLTKKLNKYNNL